MEGYLPSDFVWCTLTRTAAGLGFNVRGGIDHPYFTHDTGIFVTKVHPGKAAAVDGTLKPGDKIVEINGFQLRNLTHKSAVEKFIVKPGAQIRMRIIPKAKVHHPHPDPVPSKSEGVISALDFPQGPGAKPKPTSAVDTSPAKKVTQAEDKNPTRTSSGYWMFPVAIVAAIAVGVTAAFIIKKNQTRS